MNCHDLRFQSDGYVNNQQSSDALHFGNKSDVNVQQKLDRIKQEILDRMLQQTDTTLYESKHYYSSV